MIVAVMSDGNRDQIGHKKKKKITKWFPFTTTLFCPSPLPHSGGPLQGFTYLRLGTPAWEGTLPSLTSHVQAGCKPVAETNRQSQSSFAPAVGVFSGGWE